MTHRSSRDGGVSLPPACLLFAVSIAVLLGRAAAQDAVSVATAEELDAAIKDGVAHITLTDHIDTRLIQHSAGCTTVCSPESATALQPLATLRSIRGNCSGPVEAFEDEDDILRPELLEPEPGQCLLYTNKVLLNFYGDTSSPFQVWLDNLFIRVHRIPNDAATETQALTFNQGNAWLTKVTMQGDAGISIAMKTNFNARVYAQDCEFVGFNSGSDAFPQPGAVARLSNNASLFLENCALHDNTVTGTRGVVFLEDGGRTGPSHVAVSGGALIGNSPLPVIAKHSVGNAYASPQLTVFEQLSNSNVSTQNLDEMPAGAFATADDEAFNLIQQEATGVAPVDPAPPPDNTVPEQASRAEPPEATPAGDDISGDGLSVGVLVAIIVSAVMLLALLVGAALFALRRRRKGTDTSQQSKNDAVVASNKGSSSNAAVGPMGLEACAHSDATWGKSYSGTEGRGSGNDVHSNNMLSPVGTNTRHPMNDIPGSRFEESPDGSTSPGQIDSSVFIPALSPPHPQLLRDGDGDPLTPNNLSPNFLAPIPPQSATGAAHAHQYTSSSHTRMSHPVPSYSSSHKDSSASNSHGNSHSVHALQSGLPSSPQSSYSTGNRNHPHSNGPAARTTAPSGSAVTASALHHVSGSAAASVVGLPSTDTAPVIRSSTGARAALAAAGRGAPLTTAAQLQGAARSDTLGPPGGGPVVMETQGSQSGDRVQGLGASLAALPPGGATKSAQLFHQEHTDIATVDAPSAPAPEQAASGNPEKEKAAADAKRLEEVEDLEDALDALCETGKKFLGRYTILSNVERRGGGQGVVQFAQVVGSAELVAIKFFNRVESFRREAELYESSIFKKLMPATLAVVDNADGAAHLGRYIFPPCIVIKKGQSLNEFASSNVADFITIFQTLMHVVRAVKVMHDMGYAHRDIKPGNILRRPGEHDWTLIDFGCAARIGTKAKISYSLGYTSPEVILAVEAGQRHMEASAALDIWAIGVVAFELLTRRRAFAPATHRSQVFAAIAGRTPLPWEPGSPGDVDERLKPLRGLKRTILKCLCRDPSQRPSAAALIASWDHTFDDMQTKGCTNEDPMPSNTLPSTSATSSSAGAGTGAAAEHALRNMSHWRPHTAVGSGSTAPHEDISRMGSMLQSAPSSSMQPTSSRPAAAANAAKLASGGNPSLVQTPIGSGPSAAGLKTSSAAPSITSRAGSRAGTSMHAGASTPGTGSEYGSAGARSTVPALPNFNPTHDGDDASTDRITTRGQLTDGGTTERSL